MMKTIKASQTARVTDYLATFMLLVLLLSGLPPAASAAVVAAAAAACDPNKQSCIQPGGGGNTDPIPPGGGGGGMCTPPPGGSPSCGGAGPASQGGGGSGGVMVGGGNPINLISGNKFQEETDLAALPGVLGLELKRYYNSQSSHAGLVGAQWRISYETVLVDLGSQIQILQADGRRITLSRGSNSTLCTSPQPEDGQVRIERQANGQNIYHWRWPDGRVLTFMSGSGGGYPLHTITLASGERTQLSYNPMGDLIRVQDPQGRQLNFIYGKARAGQRIVLQAVDTPLGRIRYRQDEQGRLVEAAYSTGTDKAPYQQRQYHYESQHNGGNGFALTGISLNSTDKDGKPSSQRLSTYGYSASGMATLSTKGRPWSAADKERPSTESTGIEQITLSYESRPLPTEGKPDKSGEVQPRTLGKTLLTNSLGQQTEILSAVIGGNYRLVSMRGPGCSTCGPSNRSYGYDSAGRLIRTTGLDARGQPVQSQLRRYDTLGRLTELALQTYAQGKRQAPQWLQRYEYTDMRFKDGTLSPGHQPTLVAQPSVIKGKERVTRIAYNPQGQVLQVSEEGWSPIDEQGKRLVQAAPIMRSSSYRYQTINGRSVLAEIDGPLANGPKNGPEDSDITRLEWDAAGHHIAAMVSPMNRRSDIRFDTLGRIEAVSETRGSQLRYRYDAMGRVSATSKLMGGEVIGGTSYRHDPLGRVVEILAQVEGQDVPTTLQEFDLAGRLLWQADARGVLRQVRYDREGHLLVSTVALGAQRQEERYRYDQEGRLQRVDDSTGVSRELVRDAAGRLSATVDPLGRWTRFDKTPDGLQMVQAANTPKPLTTRYASDARGHLREVVAVGSDGKGSLNAVTHRRWHDDFGREVAVESPDSGLELRRFDLAGRMIAVQLADGTGIELDYDLDNHLLRRSVSPRANQGPSRGGIPTESARPETVRFVYEQSRLVEVVGPEQRERRNYDGHGWLVGKTLTLTLNDGAEATVTTRYRHDALGQLIGESLPDGSELVYERDSRHQIVALHRQHSHWAPFGWGRTTLVSRIERDLVGLRSLTYGNGISGEWQRSREGVLARVAYRSPVQAAAPVRVALEHLIPAAIAAGGESSLSRAAEGVTPGAFGLAADPNALWDSRLLFDAAGNVLVQAQFANGAAASAGTRLLAYDGLDQLAIASAATPRAKAAQVGAPLPVDSASNDDSRRYLHDSLGNRLLVQEPQRGEATVRTQRVSQPGTVSGDASNDEVGRPLADAQRRYAWSPLGRLAAVTVGGQTTRYRYNHLGLRVAKQGQSDRHYLYDEGRHRVAELDAKGRVERQYVWLGGQLVAILDSAATQAARAPAEGRVAALQRLAQALWQQLRGNATSTAYVHANHLGAPVAVTDVKGRAVWAADYAPFGGREFRPSSASVLLKVSMSGRGASAGASAYTLDLRMPGQWEDEESGLYYNDQRYYDLQAGRYLSPDPLGLRGGLNAYAYVGNNPLGYSDPLGLVLFAFDGTGNTEDLNWLDSHQSSLSNVMLMRQLYNDGNASYVSGVGTVHHDGKYDDITPHAPWYVPLSAENGDMGGNYTGLERINRMIQYFNDEADMASDDETAMEVDIIGFSRGAAQARDFANFITARTTNGYYRYKSADGTEHCQKLDFRFMGLFDTVLSTNNSGHAYNLAIPDEFAYVAQAAALNEYRGDTTHAGLSSFGAFPLESISDGMASPVPEPGKTRIERGFIGAHADIGGGFGENENQLAQVALFWMVEQAKAAGVAMKDAPGTIIANPVIHDKSDSILTGAPVPKAEDRTVRYRNGTTTTQREMVFSSGMSYADTAQFINYFPTNDPRRRGQSQTGTVDIKAYLKWLGDNGYGIGLKEQ